MLNEEGKEFYHLIHNLHSGLMTFELKHIHDGFFKDLTLNEVHTIEYIGHLEQQTMSELSEKAGVRQSTMSVMVNKLIKKGYALRFRNEEDRRVVKVGLTSSGMQVHKLHDELHQKVADEWLMGLESREKQCLMDVLRKLNEY